MALASPPAAPPSPHDLWIGRGAALLTVMIWSGWVVLTRLAVTTTFTVWDMAVFRYVIPALVLAPTAVRNGLRSGRLGWPGSLVMSVGAGVPFLLLFALASRLAPAAHIGGVLSTVMPMMAAVLAYLFLGERLGAVKVAGLALIFAGVLMLGAVSVLFTVGQEWRGHALLFTAASLWACYTVALRGSGVSSFHGTAIVCSLSSAVVLTALALGAPSHLATAPLDQIALQAVYQGLLTGVVAMSSYNLAVRRLGAASASAFISLVPGGASLLGWAILGEEIGLPSMIGIVVVSLGVALASGVFTRRSAGGT